MAKKKKSKSSSKKGFNLKESLSNFWKNQSPAVRPMVVFLGSMLVFYMIYLSEFFITNLDPIITGAQANIGSFLTNIFGKSTTAAGSVVSGKDFSMDISGGCDGIEVMAILIAGILAFPASWSARLKGILAGGALLAVLNLLRFPALYFAGASGSMELFDFLHIQGGFIIFVTITIVIWLYWASWSMKSANGELRMES